MGVLRNFASILLGDASTGSATTTAAPLHCGRKCLRLYESCLAGCRAEFGGSDCFSMCRGSSLACVTMCGDDDFLMPSELASAKDIVSETAVTSETRQIHPHRPGAAIVALTM